VVVTDLDTRHLAHLTQTNVEVRQHDIVRDPLEQAAFDLVYTRLVLQHIPERAHALQRMLAALKPGGWIVIEDYDGATDLADPTMYSGERRLRTRPVIVQVMTARGVDLGFGRRVLGLLKAAGLQDVEAEGSLTMYQAQSPGTLLMRTAIEQLRPALVATGAIAEAEVERDLAVLEQGDFLMPSFIMWTTWGRQVG
jgi:SAM-dependent methyltransferase